MLFNSPEFIFLFLPITFFLYFYLNHKNLTKQSKILLVFSSLFFYSWWDIAYLPIIVISMFFNYRIGKYLHNSQAKKLILIFGISINIMLLTYFKYADFMIENFNILFHSHIAQLNLLLPLAISFFTFQQIAYLVDSYKGETKEYNFLNYALFITFFPQLIAGPIVHHREMMPQFSYKRNILINYANIASGLVIFSIGLFKKVIIADTFSVWANAGFNTTETLNFIESWATSLSYTFQLYFDFSGYTDMAIGLGLLFNIKLPINFNCPYKAINIQDFWHRWHITLSRFLKDYIYIPLGGNRISSLNTYRNLLITFIIGGIWHGAGWTFVFWGLLHGIALIIQRIWSNFGIKLWQWLAWFITFNFINIAWVFFRAKDWDTAISIIHSMFGLNNIIFTSKHEKYLSFLSSFPSVSFGNVTQNIGDGSTVLNWLIFGFILISLKNSNAYIEKEIQPWLMITSAFLFAYAMIITLISSTQVFLYYNF